MERNNAAWRNERFAQMLDSGEDVDVFFLVGRTEQERELFSARKYMLAAVSEVFEGQFLQFNEMTGTQEGTEEKPILVTDVHPDAFWALLRFIYADDFSGVNKQNIMGVYYAGKKYMIDVLVSECRQWLLNDDQNLDADNVLYVLKHAQFHNDDALISRCWTFVDNNAKTVIDSEDFLMLNDTDLREMFSRDFPGIDLLKLHLLDTGRGANMHFLVGHPGENKELISGHKFILIAASDVFRSYTQRSHNQQAGSTKEKPIPVPDVHPDAFRVMFRFIYKDILCRWRINNQNILNVYYAGKIHMIDDLVDLCRQVLFKKLHVGNMFSVLKHAKRHEDTELINHCRAFIDKNIKDVLDSKEFFALNEADLCELFSRDTLEADELSLFKFLHQWAIRKCGRSFDRCAKREVVGKTIYQIRFPLIIREEFIKYIVPTGLLTREDELAMFAYYNNRFTCKPRSKFLPH